MSTQHFTPLPPNGQSPDNNNRIPRRKFLTTLAAATLAMSGATMIDVPEESPADSLPPGCAQTCNCLFPCPAFNDKWHAHFDDIEFSYPPAPPYGPESRTVLIDACLAKIDETIISLERFYDHIAEARAIAPDRVDGAKWIKLEYEVIDAEMELDNAMQSSQFFEDALEAATGKRSYYWCIKADLINNEKIDAAFVQSEINAFREDYPGQVAELQALLNARLGVQNG